MSLKITVLLCLLGLVQFGSVLSQTKPKKQPNESNVSTDSNRPPNIVKINPNRIQAIMSPELQTETIDEIQSAACGYLNEADAAKIFGKPMLYYTSTTFEKELKCIYMPPKEFPLGITFEVKIYPTVSQAKAQIKSLVETSKAANREIRLKDFPKARIPFPKFTGGIGESAYFATAGDNYEYVYFQKGKTVFEINVIGPIRSNFDENELKKIARRIAENFQAGDL